MTLYFSKSNRGFYAEEIHGKARPDDCVPITEEDHRRLLNEQAAGKEIHHDEDGRPVTRELSHTDQGPFVVAIARSLLNKSDVVLLRCVEAGVPLPEEWKQYRRTLRDVVNAVSTDIPKTPEKPQGI